MFCIFRHFGYLGMNETIKDEMFYMLFSLNLIRMGMFIYLTVKTTIRDGKQLPFKRKIKLELKKIFKLLV